jgi:hypothetical protein
LPVTRIPNNPGVRGGKIDWHFPVRSIEFEELMCEETGKFSPNQLKVWRNGRSRVVKELVDVTGDKPVTELSEEDGLDYVEWYRERVKAKDVEAGTANKSMGMLSRMLKEISIRRRLKIPEIFKGLRLRAPESDIRRPFDPAFIQSRLPQMTRSMAGAPDRAPSLHA